VVLLSRESKEWFRLNVVDVLKRLVEFPSYQVALDRVEEGMKECASFLSQSLEASGFRVEVDELFNVTGERGFDGEKSFLLNTHFDTVPPSSQWSDANEPKLEGNRLIGLGSSDAKGGIAAVLSALSQLDSSRFGKLIVQFVNYEDNSIEFQGRRRLGTPFFLSNHPDFKVDYGMNVEPTVVDDGWTVNLGCTGRVSFSVTTIGKEAHSSTPQLGRNAVYDMARVIEEIRRIPPGRFKIDGFEGEMPINVATIQGGRALNIVPEQCKITCERRIFPNEDPQRIIETIRSRLEHLQDIKAVCDFGSEIQPPYLIERDHEVVPLVVDSASRKLGYRPHLRVGLGRTDSMYLYHLAGIKTVIMGPGNKGHVTGEFINVDRLNEFVEILGNVLRK
jgi:acetylornithine deacetylase/succinyl-diaminopimelate desuccinylase-like protein